MATGTATAAVNITQIGGAAAAARIDLAHAPQTPPELELIPEVLAAELHVVTSAQLARRGEVVRVRGEVGGDPHHPRLLRDARRPELQTEAGEGPVRGARQRLLERQPEQAGSRGGPLLRRLHAVEPVPGEPGRLEFEHVRGRRDRGAGGSELPVAAHEPAAEAQERRRDAGGRSLGPRPADLGRRERDVRNGTRQLPEEANAKVHRARFAVVAHLLSVENNWRLRVRTWAPDDEFPMVASLMECWPAVGWFEREAFDLYGIVFEGHPDLRRILTDYGFVGHPFRKDFPLSGTVEMRYDPDQQRVIYQPVTIDPRETTPRIVREKHYAEEKNG